MNTTHIESKFVAMGARFKAQPESWRTDTYALDIKHDRHGAFYELRGPEAPQDEFDLQVLQIRPRERHLLLLVRRSGPGGQKDRFLCGHDERDWFVAAVPGNASTVADAMESLKPSAVQAAQARQGLNVRQRQRRHNRAFLRQGEWFFVPVPSLEPDPKVVLRHEPIRRGRGKPHWVEELYREGGVQVRVCAACPNGVTDSEYQQLVREDPSRARWPWRLMQREATVYARGRVRHPDHATLVLNGWHQVFMNTESRSSTMSHVAFLD
jgi:hypothetical protein